MVKRTTFPECVVTSIPQYTTGYTGKATAFTLPSGDEVLVVGTGLKGLRAMADLVGKAAGTFDPKLCHDVVMVAKRDVELQDEDDEL